MKGERFEQLCDTAEKQGWKVGLTAARGGLDAIVCTPPAGIRKRPTVHVPVTRGLEVAAAAALEQIQ